MFAPKCDHDKLKTNMRTCVQRIQVIGKKRTENNQKARREIANLLEQNKAKRAQIKVESIIRDDYYVEALDTIEGYLDKLIANFERIKRTKTIDSDLDKAVATLIWSSDRICNDIKEIKDICIQFKYKYSKEHTIACQQNKLKNVDLDVIKRLDLSPIDPVLVEDYLCEIAKSYKVEYERDPKVMPSYLGRQRENDNLLDLDNLNAPNDPHGNMSSPSDNVTMHKPSSQQLPYPDDSEFPLPSASSDLPYPAKSSEFDGDFTSPPPYHEFVKKSTTTNHHQDDNEMTAGQDHQSTPIDNDVDLLPQAPSAGGAGNQQDVDFDELTRRFENLRKPK